MTTVVGTKEGVDCHGLCSRASLFSKFPDHTLCEELEGDEGGVIMKYKWNHNLLCLVNQPITDGVCNLVVVYDYTLKPGNVFHFITLDEAMNYLEIVFERKAA
jgi:hypothetical protein